MRAGANVARPALRQRLAQAPRALLRRALLRGLRPPRLRHDPPASEAPGPWASISRQVLPGARGQPLVAWIVRPRLAGADDRAPVVIALHGWGANASTLWAVVEPLAAAGLAVVLFDASCHGQSGDEDFASLPRFADDIAALRALLRHAPGLDTGRVALLGHSVGAAAVLLQAAQRGGVRAIVSLAAFAHPREVMERWLSEHRLPRRWLGDAILEEVQRTIGARFDAIAPVHVAASIDCPVLLVHGARDDTVPLDDARRLQAALQHAELLVVDADHDLRDSLAPHAHRIVRFLTTHLAPPPTTAA